MPISVHQSLRQSMYVPNQKKHTNFRAVDPYADNHKQLFKSNNIHYRHKSQPVQEDCPKDQSQYIKESFQEVLRKAKKKVFHMRLASQTSDTWNRPSKKTKKIQFQYNKWYIEPSLRLKKPFNFGISKTQRFATKDMEINFSSFNKLRQSLQVETSDTPVQKFEKVDKIQKFVNSFVQNDHRNLALLKQFKRKQKARKCRTPQLANKDRKQSKLPNKSMKTAKGDDWCLESAACSKAVSKFNIEELDPLKRGNSHKGVKKKLKLLQSEYTRVKENISREIEDKQRTNDKLIDRFKVRM